MYGSQSRLKTPTTHFLRIPNTTGKCQLTPAQLRILGELKYNDARRYGLDYRALRKSCRCDAHRVGNSLVELGLAEKCGGRFLYKEPPLDKAGWFNNGWWKL